MSIIKQTLPVLIHVLHASIVILGDVIRSLWT